MLKGIVIWGVASLASAIMGGFIASWKNRDYSFWMAWSFILPGLVPLLLLLLPRLTGPRPRRPTLDQLDRHDDRLL